MSDPTAHERSEARQLALRIAQDLERVPGVLAAAVSLGEPPRVRDIYIAAARDASLAAIQNSTAEVLGANGLLFSTDAIHIGVLDDAVDAAPASQPEETAIPTTTPNSDTSPPPVWQGRFLVLGSLDTQRTENRITCQVQLQRLGESFSGEANELDTRTGRARAAARACLLAAQQAADGAALSLEGVQLIDFFGRPHVVLSVEAAAGRRSANLPGIVAVVHSIEDAACLATLGAIERWLAW